MKQVKLLPDMCLYTCVFEIQRYGKFTGTLKLITLLTYSLISFEFIRVLHVCPVDTFGTRSVEQR